MVSGDSIWPDPQTVLAQESSKSTSSIQTNRKILNFPLYVRSLILQINTLNWSEGEKTKKLWMLYYYRVKIGFMALLLHETIPGHHLQVSNQFMNTWLVHSCIFHHISDISFYIRKLKKHKRTLHTQYIWICSVLLMSLRL